ncbi:cohesin loading factor-domain-containing protein [Cercophora newfieldiana]|uniref:Cohesin loading factor-domain-containing protein n=1 Tax=Cercophora newfieldiana TaxID=92897 RepID=A0AA40CVF7_9PEZI|nr:cohesin loading factor-domain-containing protein [Cercophora newfieldiana]
MPPGPGYGGQGQQQQPQHPQYSRHPQHPNSQHPQYQQHVHQNIHPQYGAAPYANGNQQYHHVQYSQPMYQQQPQQQHQQRAAPAPVAPAPAPFYPSTTPQFSNYDGAYNQPPPSTVAPVQFVDPSFLQRPVAPSQPKHIPPVSASQPAPAATPVVNPGPARATLPPQQATSATSSPRLPESRPASQGGPGRPTSKDARRLTSGGSVAKSPVMSHSSSHIETVPVLLHVAEDCFSKANAVGHNIARSMTDEELSEHHKIVATGLACLELAMKSNKILPRLEARLCLRYASILVDETNNVMEAETALTRSFAVCEKHRFYDLKYSSQFLLMKTLFQRNQKAAFKSLDAYIADCTTFKHIHWMYAFRFLKAAFHVQAGTASDHHALENLRKIAAIATDRDDKAIFVTAVILEGLAHLGSQKDDWITRVQTCIAQAAKLQLNDDVHIPQMDVLLLFMDLACSLHRKSPTILKQKMEKLQAKLEQLRHSNEWAARSDEMLLPIRRLPNAPLTISNDTRGVIRLGEGNIDYLVLTTLGKQEVYALAFVFNGIVALSTATTHGRSSSFWGEAVRGFGEKKTSSVARSLPEAVKQADWVAEIVLYSHMLVGLQAATLCDWARVKIILNLLKNAQPAVGFPEIMTLYLNGVLMQGTMQSAAALEIWLDPMFDLDRHTGPKANTSHIGYQLSILAALSRLWILNANRDEVAMVDLIDQLRPLCEDNPDVEIKMAYHLVLSSLNFSPPRSMQIQQVKAHIQHALSISQSAQNTHCLSMALNIMRSRLFENVSGDQALKSARAAAQQAARGGNILWKSVGEGMLARTYELMGMANEANAAQEAGVKYANEAYARTQANR